MTTTHTAREITAAMRLLFPAPVRISARADTGPGNDGRFILRMPSASARSCGGQRDRFYNLTGFLGRHLSSTTAPVDVQVVATRDVRRRDCGRDVEFTLRIGE